MGPIARELHASQWVLLSGYNINITQHIHIFDKMTGCILVQVNMVMVKKQRNKITAEVTRRRHRHRKKTGAGDSLFARLYNTIIMPMLMKIRL